MFLKYRLISVSMEELNDENENNEIPLANDNEGTNENIHDFCEKNTIYDEGEKRNKIVSRFSSLKDIFQKNNSSKNIYTKKLKINFNKYLVNTESFANDIKDHEEENLFMNNKSIVILSNKLII